MGGVGIDPAFLAAISGDQGSGGGLLFNLDWRNLGDYSTRVYSPYEEPGDETTPLLVAKAYPP